MSTIQILDWNSADQKTKKCIMERSQVDVESVKPVVADWIHQVRNEGDQAVLRYIQKFDDKNFKLHHIRVTEDDVQRAYDNIKPEVLVKIREQIKISRQFHAVQAEKVIKEWQIESVPGVITGTKITPIDAVGLYVPAGKAPLPTVSQILTVAAKAAEVPRIVVCFAPTGDYPEIIVAAKEAGADEIYRVGGIVAIAAFAYGTETIKPVNFIAGPGNPYVQAAKLQVFGRVGIDMLSGPSEALIMADESSNPVYLAADILARCEHGADSAGVLVTNSRDIAEKTKAEVERQAPLLKRQQYIPTALERFSAIVLVEDRQAMIEFANDYSAEHLEIQMKDPLEVMKSIRNAGAIFLGDYAPVAVGDYASGTNHCLPTGRAVKFSSPVNVSMFQKKVEFQSLTKEGLAALRPIVETISDVEGLDAHKRSVQIRFENL
jgi:histidinol dehydrogenase